jgi:hypothetical protein
MCSNLQDAVTDQTIPASEEERRSVGDQLRDEGKRAELLRIAERIEPEDLSRFEAIDDLEDLRAAAMALLDV